MRLPNGYGSISKLSGNRRKPYMVVLTQGYVRVDLNIKRNRIVLGYLSNKKRSIKSIN